MDGIEVLEELRADESTASIPVVMLTARTDIRDQQAAWEAGVSDYVTKPFDGDQLITAVRDTIKPDGGAEREVWRQRAVERLQAGDVEVWQQLAAIVEESNDATIGESQSSDSRSRC